MITPANKCADRCWRGIKNVDPIFFDNFPEPIRFRPIRRAFVHDRCCTVRERTIDDVAVASDPADISRAPKDIFVANVEDVFRGRVNADQIAARSMEDAFGFASGTTCIEKIKRMLALESRGRTVRIHILQLAMPPDLTALFHRSPLSGATEYDGASNSRA